MDIIKLFDKYDKKICLALGFFDSIHIGHQEIFRRAKELAYSKNAQFAVFTFSNNPYVTLGKDVKLIYPYEQRIKYIAACGADLLIVRDFDAQFMNEDKDAFLTGLFGSYDIAGVVMGSDYTFGARGKGTIADFISFCKPRGIDVTVINDVALDYERVSTTGIRALIRQGNTELLNTRLGRDYAVEGTVVRGRGDGGKNSVPTANIPMPKGCEELHSGVYATDIVIGGSVYLGVTNVGGQPTYGSDSPMIETHIPGFSGNLYGQNITVRFWHRIRDTVRFNDKESLRTRIAEDIRYVNDKNRSRR